MMLLSFDLLIILMPLAGKHDNVTLLRILNCVADCLRTVNDRYILAICLLHSGHNIIKDRLRLLVSRII